MDKIPGYTANFFSSIFGSLYTNFGSYVPFGTYKIFIVGIMLTIFVLSVIFLSAQKSFGQIKSDQNAILGGTMDSISQTRKGVNDYLTQKDVEESRNNWILFNFAPLTIYDAGYMGPGLDGVYDTQAIRRALDMGFRCFVFHIDMYEGPAKDPKLFVPPGEPCLLHRDDQGVIRSINCGKIDEMMESLAQQAFSPSMTTGNDPLIVILDFKNTPDRAKDESKYFTFLSTVAEKIQPLSRTFLDRLGESRFSMMENPGLLFTQNFQALRGRTLIFTNVNTDLFTGPRASNLPLYKNLRRMIHAQMYSLSSDALPRDPVTEVVPKGSIMTVGRQNASYFLMTPPDKIQDAQLKTNNVYTLINAPEAFGNFNKDDVTSLMEKYGAQMVGFQPFINAEQTEKYFAAWGPYSWKLKPKNLQYVVVKAEPAKPISQRANANGGNIAPPALRF
jgi:hypothetical protein